jgi:hypothetical protein
MDKLEIMISKFKKDSKRNSLDLRFHENFNSKKQRAKIKRENLKKMRGKENDKFSRKGDN